MTLAPKWVPVWLAIAFLASGCNPPGKPTLPQTSGRPEDLKDFDALYSSNCAACHGKDGTLGPAPPLNDPLFLRIVPDAELVRVITEGRAGTPMAPFDHSKGGPLTTAQVKILAAGLKTKWGTPGVMTDVPGYALAPGGNSEDGMMTFMMACASCHGENGKGGKSGEQRVGAINDPAYLALSSNQALRRYIITGRPDLGMPSYNEKTNRPHNFKTLTAQDVADLTSLLDSWRSPATK
ncbi:MAG: c-type cytochrome [Planctomycetes bacterium]|nr:c-type cytochrome [Planctomycetota bacterium]